MRSDYRSYEWQIGVLWLYGRKQGDERLEPGGTATFSGGTASARAKAGEQTKSWQLHSISHPGPFGV